MKFRKTLISILTIFSVLILFGASTFAAPVPDYASDGGQIYNYDELIQWNKSLISEYPNRVDEVKINGTGSIYDTDHAQFTANVRMIAGTSTGVQWSVSGPATIDQNGYLTPTGSGEAVVKATANEPSIISTSVRVYPGEGPADRYFLDSVTHKSAEYKLYIATNPKRPAGNPTPSKVTSISLDKSTLQFMHNKDGSWSPQQHTLTARLQPAGISGKTVNWYEDSPAIDLIPSTDNSIIVKPTGETIPGKVVTITAECDGKAATCQLSMASRYNGDLSVRTDKQNENITAGGTFSLNASVTSKIANKVNLNWKSSNPAIAAVDNQGNVTGISAGTATITVTAQSGDLSASADCIVNVASAPVKTIDVTGVELSPSSLNLNKSETKRITATVLPANATDRAISWGSSNSNVATVDSSGNVVAVGPGNTLITATSHNGIEGRAIVNVKDSELVAAPTSVSLSVNNKILNIGEEVILAATVLPAGVIQDVTWTSSNAAVANVVGGKVTAHTPGFAVITATAKNGVTGSCSITVNQSVQAVQNVTRVSLDSTSKTLKEGDSFILNETVTPTNATNTAVSWRSSNDKVANVIKGKVTAVSKGTAIISVVTDDGQKVAQCTVKVEPVETNHTVNVTGIKLDKSSVTLENGQSVPLNQTITPSDATNKTIYWYFTDDQVAKVNDVGIVVGVGVGTANITVVTDDGRKSAECEVTVTAVAEDIPEEIEPVDPVPENPGTTNPDNNPQPEPDTPIDPQPQPSTPTVAPINVTYETHIENIGWGNVGTNGSDSGTTGRSLRLEGIKINVSGDSNLGIAYKTHVEDYGWMGFVGDGAMSGTQGQSKRLEAIQIQLTGADQDKYDVYYRVHAQDVGWMNWAKNGQSAGTAGLARRLEAIEIQVVPKGQVPAIPASTPNVTDQAFIQK